MTGPEAMIRSCDGIYTPREDSYLLSDAVMRIAKAGSKALDLGTGTGIQGITAALLGCSVTFSDIEEKAVECAKRNAELNGVSGRFVTGDMFDSIVERFDMIIFNPPYVPSDALNEGVKGEDRALLGGVKGREVMDRFIAEYKEHLLQEGCALIIETGPNGYDKDMKDGAEILAKAHYFFEDIVVLKLQ